MASSTNTPESQKRGPPVANPGLSLWQQTTRAFPHLHSLADVPVPASSPYVVIGSGISAGLLTYELLQNGVRGEDITLLEAREAASGASSRNAGHVRPDAFRGFENYTQHHGKEQAVKMLANERIVLEKVRRFIDDNNVQCDFNYTTTFDCCMTPAFVEYERKNFQNFKAAGGDVSHVKYYEGREATEKTGIAGVLAAYEWPAGSIHPAKLAQWLLNAIVKKGVRLFTHCPVTNIARSSSSSSKQNPLWDIRTPRGSITTPLVVHCTNAFAGLLLPELSQHIVPTRGQAHALVPVAAFTDNKVLRSTYSLRYSLDHYYSIIQRQTDGTLILGCSFPNPALPKEVIDGVRTINDTYYNEAIKTDAMTHLKAFFPKAGIDKPVHGEGLVHVWNGIVGLTTDEAPFLGPVDGRPGQFVCAGFNGHGMARIFTSAPGVAKLILGGSWDETCLPECFQISQSRLHKLSSSSKSVAAPETEGKLKLKAKIC